MTQRTVTRLPEDAGDPADASDADTTTKSGGDTGNPFLRPVPFRPGDLPCCTHAQTRTGSEGNYRVDWARCCRR